MCSMKYIVENKKGAALISVLTLLVVVLPLLLLLTRLIVGQVHTSGRAESSSVAIVATETGLEHALYLIRHRGHFGCVDKDSCRINAPSQGVTCGTSGNPTDKIDVAEATCTPPVDVHESPHYEVVIIDCTRFAATERDKWCCVNPSSPEPNRCIRSIASYRHANRALQLTYDTPTP